MNAIVTAVAALIAGAPLLEHRRQLRRGRLIIGPGERPLEAVEPADVPPKQRKKRGARLQLDGLPCAGTTRNRCAEEPVQLAELKLQLALFTHDRVGA